MTRSAVTLALLAALGVAGGASLGLQAVVNARLGCVLQSPLRSSLVSYLVGTACCIALLAATRQTPGPLLASLRAEPLLALGGVLGAAYLVIAVYLIPRLGSAPVFALVIGGQLFIALALDHFGAFGLVRRNVDPSKLAGAVLLICGALMIRR